MMGDQPAHRKALEALKAATDAGIVVKSVRINGREFELILSTDDDSRDEFDLARYK